MRIQNLKKEDFSGFSRQNSRASLSDERFYQRVRRFASPFLEPTQDARTEIARALCKEMFRQLRRAPLQIALADFNHREELMAFALPLRSSMFAPQSFAEETQVMRTTKQIT